MPSFDRVSDIPNIEPLIGQKESYRLLNNPHTASAVVFLKRRGMLSLLSNDESISDDMVLDGLKAPEFGQATIDWIEAQGFVDRMGDDTLVPTEKGKAQFDRAHEMEEIIEHNGQFIDSVKLEHQMENHGAVVDLQKELNGKEKTDVGVKNLVAPAVTYLAGAPLINPTEEFRTVGDWLLANRLLKIEDIDVQSQGNVALYLSVLQGVQALEYISSENAFKLTSRGRSLVYRAGGAELTLSYNRMLQKRYALAMGQLDYGFQKDLDRDAETNAHASNAITAVKAAAVAIDKIKELGGNDQEQSYVIDYGSGGAHLLARVMQEGAATNGIGIDINEKTNIEARKLLTKLGLASRVDLKTGSIWSSEVVQNVAQIIKNRLAFATIFALQHDIGPEAAAKQLRIHAEFLSNVPLISTETPRVPMHVLRHNPHERAAAFQDMHTSSGQYLYSLEELLALHADNGFEQISLETLAYLKSANDEPCPTAVTLTSRPILRAA